MKRFEIIFYEKEDGTVPVEEFLDTLPEKMRAKVLKEIEVLEEYGNALREPYTKYLGDGLFELRIKMGTDISRVLYFFYKGGEIIFTNGFIKKTWKTPKREIKRAREYKNDYLCRKEREDAF